MSKFNQISRVAFLVSTAVSLAACDSGSGGGVSGGGATPVEVASDFCEAVLVADNAVSYSSNIANLVDSTEPGEFQYSVAEQPSNGTLTLDPSTGDYTFTPSASLGSARGFRTSFTYGVLEDGEQVDSGIVELIYGARRIMPLGDSITYGVTNNLDGTTAGDRPIPSTAIGYRKTLYDSLIDSGYLVDFVGSQSAGTDPSVELDDPDHEGRPGWTADQLEAQVSGWLTDSRPDVVLMHAGTNDLGFQVQSPVAAATDVHDLVATMEIWHQTNQPLTVMAAKIVRPNDSSFFNSTVSNTLALNTSLESQLDASFDNSLSENFGVHIVDQFNALNAVADINSPATGDFVGLHPSTDGYNKMAAAWLAELTDPANGEILAKCE